MRTIIRPRAAALAASTSLPFSISATKAQSADWIARRQSLEAPGPELMLEQHRTRGRGQIARARSSRVVSQVEIEK
jgi:hypothetical protein